MSLTRWKVKEDHNLSAYSVCDESDVTHFLEGEGGRAICQPTPHAINPTSLTSWKVKEEGNSSAHVACNESDITYKLQGERGQFISPHAMNLTSLTRWKVKMEGNSSAHTACDQSSITYVLEGKGEGQFVSPCCMRWIWCHLLAGRRRRKGNSSAHTACDESNVTYKLEGEGEWQFISHAACDAPDVTYMLEGEMGRQFVSPHCMWWIRRHLQAETWRKRTISQPMPHAMNPTSLTHWMGKGEGNWSAHAACDEADVTYKLEDEGGGQLVSPCRMRWIWCHLLAAVYYTPPQILTDSWGVPRSPEESVRNLIVFLIN